MQLAGLLIAILFPPLAPIGCLIAGEIKFGTIIIGSEIGIFLVLSVILTDPNSPVGGAAFALGIATFLFVWIASIVMTARALQNANQKKN